MPIKSDCSPEEWEWLKARYPHMETQLLCDDFEAEFGHRPKEQTVRCYMSRKGIKRNIVRICWDEEKDGFLREVIPGHTESEIRAAFANRFGITLTEAHIGNAKARLGVKSGTKGGQFKKGLVPFNKGKTWDEIGLSQEARNKALATCFKKGHIPHNAKDKPVGYERVDHNGYTWVKVKDGAQTEANDNFRLKHHVVWEEHNGPIPPSTKIVFADKDTRNFDPDNLVAVPKTLWALISSKGIAYWDKASLETAMLLAKVTRARFAAETRPRECGECGKTFKPRYVKQRRCDACLERGRK